MLPSQHPAQFCGPQPVMGLPHACDPGSHCAKPSAWQF
jgi:hypothetical protein